MDQHTVAWTPELEPEPEPEPELPESTRCGAEGESLVVLSRRLSRTLSFTDSAEVSTSNGKRIALLLAVIAAGILCVLYLGGAREGADPQLSTKASV